VTASPNSVAFVKTKAFSDCLSLEILMASVEFELDTGDRWGSYNDPTVGLIRFLKWQDQEDANNKAYYETAMVMPELSDRQDSSGSLRASTDDPL